VRNHLRALLAALVALSVVASVAQAEPPAGAGAGKVVPFKSVAGFTAEDVAVALFTPFYTGEATQECPLFAGGKLLFPTEGSTCTVKPGTKVIAPLPGVSCSDAEPAPYFGATEAEQRACAESGLRDFTRIAITVDGGRPQTIGDRFQVTTDQFSVITQPDNPFGADPGPTTLVVASYAGLVKGLPPGRHTIVASGELFGEPYTATFTVEVVPPGRRG
jgi:hypothetical protein